VPGFGQRSLALVPVQGPVQGLVPVLALVPALVSRPYRNRRATC